MEAVGYIKDLPSFLKGSIALVPIRIGSGMRMKILEAVSADIPFITTTKGVEGIDLLDKEEYLKADSATEFADAIITLSQNTELQEKLVKQAKSKNEGYIQSFKHARTKIRHLQTDIKRA